MKIEDRPYLYGKLNEKIVVIPCTFEKVPSTPTSNGISGQMAFDENYLYLCITTNKWKRIPLQDWEVEK